MNDLHQQNTWRIDDWRRLRRAWRAARSRRHVYLPAGSPHQVTPVTRGARVASSGFKVLVADKIAQRTLLVDLDTAIQGLDATDADQGGCSNNLSKM